VEAEKSELGRVLDVVDNTCITDGAAALRTNVFTILLKFIKLISGPVITTCPKLPAMRTNSASQILGRKKFTALATF
jgi:hypothetical protein